MRGIPTLKISISGVRGVVGDSLTPLLLTRFAQAFGTCMGAGRIVIGRDTRRSGEMVRQAVVAGLLSTGSRIADVGVCPTPTVQLGVRHLGAQGGIAITASHNPAEWNALKFVGPDGLFLSGARGRELLDVYHQGEYRRVPGGEMRDVEARPDLLDLHVRTVIEAVGPLPARARRLRVALDACNGAGAIVTPRLLEALGADVVAIHTTPDGSFPRPAEPTPENLAALATLVRESGADVGFAQDMDADRLAIVSERGDPIGEELTLVLAARYVLARTPGTIVTNLSTTHRLDTVAAGFGCRVVRTPVGEAHVAAAMERERAVIGGEGNGGVIYPAINFGRDSLVAIALVTHLLADAHAPLSAIVDALPGAGMVKVQAGCPSQRVADVLRRVRQVYAASELDLRDGVKVRLADRWFHVRGSNTEPIVRVVAEAPDEASARGLADEVFGLVADTLAR